MILVVPCVSVTNSDECTGVKEVQSCSCLRNSVREVTSGLSCSGWTRPLLVNKVVLSFGYALGKHVVHETQCGLESCYTLEVNGLIRIVVGGGFWETSLCV
jgi:hypothetical protein